jgi:DNA repair protein RadC
MEPESNPVQETSYWKKRMSDEKLQKLDDVELLARTIHLRLRPECMQALPVTLRWAKARAAKLLNSFGTIEKMSAASWRALAGTAYFNDIEAIQLRAGFLLGQRVALRTIKQTLKAEGEPA